jgi:hypothetical protein
MRRYHLTEFATRVFRRDDATAAAEGFGTVDTTPGVSGINPVFVFVRVSRVR